MSTPQEILLQVQTQLKNSTALSYVDDTKIFLGMRANPDNFPCIFIEPLNIADTSGAVTGIQYLIMKIAIAGFVLLDTGTPDEVLADASLNSILKLENDIKKSVDADQTLSQKVYCTNYIQSSYDFSAYPLRGVQIEIECKFKQITTTRS
jgi:hypothetical protein